MSELNPTKFKTLEYGVFNWKDLLNMNWKKVNEYLGKCNVLWDGSAVKGLGIKWDGDKWTQSNIFKSVSADYTTSGEDIIGVTDTTAARTITVSASDCVEGKTMVIKDESGGAGTNNITITVENGKTIDGATTQVINTNYGAIRLYSDGINLFTF